MEMLNQQEIEQVSGGKFTVGEAAGLTVGLMALAVSSPVVVTVGIGALFVYAIL